jgi:two-component system, OmpR family, response regulator CpxR
MRPKKVILCVGVDEQLLSQRAFLLETRGNCHVVKAESAKRAEDVLRQMTINTVDVMVVQAPLEGALTLLRSAHILHPFMRTLVASEFAGFDANLVHADVYLPRGCWEPAVLLERIRILCARPRGPHKKPVASVGLSIESKKDVA